MNYKVILAAIFIAVLTTSATSYSPAAAISSPQRQNTPDIVLSIPTNNVTYEVNGTFYAWVNVTSFSVVATASGFPGFKAINITVPEFYIGIRISVGAKNVSFFINPTDPSQSYVQGNVTVIADVTGRAKAYVNVTGGGAPTFDNSFQSHATKNWNGKLFIPWGSTKNFTMPFPFFDLNASAPDSTTADANAGIQFTNANLTSSDVSWTVTHNSWDFSTWLQNKINSTLNGIAGGAMKQILEAGIPGISMGFTVPTSIGKVDVWKGNATTPDTQVPNVLLMASALVNLLVKYYAVGHSTEPITVTIGGTSITLTYNVNIGADFGMFFSLIVTSNLGDQVLSNYEINTISVQVPENATLTVRKIGVIVYYGSPAHGCDVTGGQSMGYLASSDGVHKMFFVDYGWDGTPDFATNGSVGIEITHPTATVSGSAPKFTVQLDKSAGGWIYFNLTLPSGTSKSNVTVTRSDGAAVNSTQYWVQDGVLYVCDDPTYTYTVSLATSGLSGSTTLLIVGATAVVVILVLALVLVRRRGAKPTNVSIK